MLKSQFITWRSRSGQEMRTCFADSGAMELSGTPLIFIHGVGMSKSFWEPQVAHFTAARRVVIYDMLGHGGSSVSSEGGDLMEYSDQLLALLDYLGLPTVDLAGHSMGGLVSLEFALNHPERVSRVAALNAVFCRSDAQREAVVERANTLLNSDMRRGLDATIERWFGNPVPADMRATADDVRNALVSADPVGYARAYMIFATSDRRHSGRLGQLQMPALFLTGELDANSNSDMSRTMAAQAPMGRAVIIPGQRHMMSMVAPWLVDDALDKFFGEENGSEI